MLTKNDDETAATERGLLLRIVEAVASANKAGFDVSFDGPATPASISAKIGGMEHWVSLTPKQSVHEN